MLVKVEYDLYVNALEVTSLHVVKLSESFHLHIQTPKEKFTIKFQTREAADVKMKEVAGLINKTIEQIGKREEVKLNNKIRQLMVASTS